MVTIGERIRLIRKAYGLNQATFAHRLGLETAAAIVKYENGTARPDIEKLMVIARMGWTTVDWLATGSIPPADVRRISRCGAEMTAQHLIENKSIPRAIAEGVLRGMIAPSPDLLALIDVESGTADILPSAGATELKSSSPVDYERYSRICFLLRRDPEAQAAILNLLESRRVARESIGELMAGNMQRGDAED